MTSNRDRGYLRRYAEHKLSQQNMYDNYLGWYNKYISSLGMGFPNTASANPLQPGLSAPFPMPIPSMQQQQQQPSFQSMFSMNPLVAYQSYPTYPAQQTVTAPVMVTTAAPPPMTPVPYTPTPPPTTPGYYPPGMPFQPYPGQPGMPYPGQPGYPGQYPGYPGQQYPGQPGQPGTMCANVGTMALNDRFDDPHTRACDNEPEQKVINGRLCTRKVRLRCF